jgi:adenine-specific DNA-methyltransferase
MEKLINVVDACLQIKRQNLGEDILLKEIEIDSLVYHLYGLTYDEVLIVDPQIPITREEYETQS